ncbi:MAG TPA: hypothetical protein VME17_22555 [Bryobacteraceae bacterium]|nr:hypothetical protein [Bryobacteraceae bacterium]
MGRLLIPLSFLLLAQRFGFPTARISPEAIAAFDRNAAKAELRMRQVPIGNVNLQSGELRIEPGLSGNDGEVPGGMIQDWIGTMFISGATLDRVQAVLRDYAHYKMFYAPKVIDSEVLAHRGDEYDISLRLVEKHLVTVVLNTTYHIRYSAPDPQHLLVSSCSTHVGEVKDPGTSYADEFPPGQDSGFLWRLNSYWRFRAADGGIYARCEAVSLSRDVPLGLGWMLKGFLEALPKQSMQNTLRGTRDAILGRKAR